MRTATPWKIATVFVDNAPNEIHVTTGKWGKPSIAVVGSLEDAAYIVKAVNAHEALVEALGECITLIRKYGLDYDGFMNAHGIDDDYGEADEDLHDLPDNLKKWEALKLAGDE
jgi:hypothetical protein